MSLPAKAPGTNAGGPKLFLKQRPSKEKGLHDALIVGFFMRRSCKPLKIVVIELGGILGGSEISLSSFYLFLLMLIECYQTLALSSIFMIGSSTAFLLAMTLRFSKIYLEVIRLGDCGSPRVWA